ncbi:hypothetical protein RRG08_006760, partial [Elysia crispata]
NTQQERADILLSHRARVIIITGSCIIAAPLLNLPKNNERARGVHNQGSWGQRRASPLPVGLGVGG